MKGKIPSHFGEVEISERVIAEYAGNSAVSCFGIVGMAAVPMSGKGLARLLRKVAENLMESVEYRISQFTGMEVDRINVYVEGVRIID